MKGVYVRNFYRVAATKQLIINIAKLLTQKFEQNFDWPNLKISCIWKNANIY